jgi:hypothetical protein
MIAIPESSKIQKTRLFSDLPKQSEFTILNDFSFRKSKASYPRVVAHFTEPFYSIENVPGKKYQGLFQVDISRQSCYSSTIALALPCYVIVLELWPMIPFPAYRWSWKQLSNIENRCPQRIWYRIFLFEEGSWHKFIKYRLRSWVAARMGEIQGSSSTTRGLS